MPLANSVYMTDAPPPYPGINGNNEYSIGGAGAGWVVPGTTATQQNGALPPQAPMTSAERKAAEAAGTLQTGYYDPNNPGEAKSKLHFKSGGTIDFGQAMLKAAQMAGRHYGGVNDAPPPYTPPSSDWYAAPQDYKELHTPQRE